MTEAGPEPKEGCLRPVLSSLLQLKFQVDMEVGGPREDEDNSEGVDISWTLQFSIDA